MMNSNQETLVVDGKEYVLTLNRKGVEAIEKYTNLSKKKEKLEKMSVKGSNKDEYIENISLDEDPFADIGDVEENLEETMELLKRTLWICLWERHHMNIEEVRELIVKIIDEDKLDELNSAIEKLTEGVNKTPSDYLKNTKALKART